MYTKWFRKAHIAKSIELSGGRFWLEIAPSV